MLWETGASQGRGSMMCKVKWFYHPEEIETCGRKFDLKLPGGLFQSPHTDENSVHTISHKCQVLPIKEFTRGCPDKKSSSYYLAGSYDPAGLSVHFQPGVLKSTDSDWSRFKLRLNISTCGEDIPIKRRNSAQLIVVELWLWNL